MILESLPAVLHEARDHTLYRASLTVPKDARATIDDKVRTFVDLMMIAGALGVLLAKDIGDNDGAPHWYGIIIRAGGGAIGRAWEGISGAKQWDVVAVEGWENFAATGDLDARADRNKTFRQSLRNVVDYMLKAWPAEHGARDLASDVIASGVFSAVWDDVVAHVDG
jgi:hypothetical protein